MAGMGSKDSSRHWSCSTLRDGVDALMHQANEVEDQEHDLLKLIEDPSL